ncbi:hypothetical protein Halar_3332 [halophilic archaeon DL31]|jgi:hypothetical protein|nr:hypothetical protein Halar_3332 [halophilic archaeon DL31]
MSGDEPEEWEAEYAGWERPGQSSGADSKKRQTDGEEGVITDEDEPFGPPPKMGDQIFRDRIRDRLGVTPQQWYVIETFLLVLPYLLFVFVYVTFPVNETLFLVVTLAYSVVAMYVGLLS